MAEVDDFLAHYGIRGMRWGKSKARGKNDKSVAVPPRAAGYTDKMQKNDHRRVGGSKGIEKVHQKVAEGTSLKKAREQVAYDRYKRNANITTAVAGLAYTAYVAGPLMKHMAGAALDQAVVRKKASNGQKYAANMMADKRGLTNYDTIRLHQNPTTGNWV